MTSERAPAGADFDDPIRLSLGGGRGNLFEDGFRGEEMLTELARQASSVEHAKLMDLTSVLAQ